MRKVDDYIKEKIKKDPSFKERYYLIKEKAAVVKEIVEYRIKHNLSQAQLASQLGITQQYISKIEEGEFSNIDAIGNILHHVGYRLILKVEPNKKMPESQYTPKEWEKIEKMVAEKGKIYNSAKKPKSILKAREAKFKQK